MTQTTVASALLVWQVPLKLAGLAQGRRVAWS